MRIAYCTNVRLPSERAHGHQIAQVCDALVRIGHDVTIFAPFRKNIVEDDYWTYYGADRRVQLTHVGSFDAIASPFTPGVIGLLTMNIILRRSLKAMLRSKEFDLLYTRTPALLSALLATGMPTILELHQLPRRGRWTFVRQCNRCARVVALTSTMRDALIHWGVDPKRVIAEGDAVDLLRFKDPPSRAAAREALNLHTDRCIVGYVGRLKTLGMEKGVAVMLQAFTELKSQQKFFGLIVGGPENDRRAYMQMATQLGLTMHDVICTGAIPATHVPTALAACDILAMPFPDVPHYRHHMSPLKMFEYMAAERPIVTSDLPTVRDVLDESAAIFCAPGDAQSFAEALQWTADHPREAAERSKRAKELVKRHSWEERMRRILYSAPMRIVSAVAARPNFVKLAAIHHAINASDGVEHVIVHTGQHYDPILSDVFFQQLEIPLPAYHLGVHGTERKEVIERTEKALIPVLKHEKPDCILVYGDVNGGVGAAQAAKKAGIKLAHIEAGLRSGDLSMPEEHNRIRIDELADFLFCTEQSGMDHLASEGARGEAFLLGNTMVDTLARMMPLIVKERIPTDVPPKFGIVTLHRPSNVDPEDALRSLLTFLTEVSASCTLLLPAHHRLRASLDQFGLRDAIPATIRLFPSLPYVQFLRLVQEAAFILTDSGGIQEEATYLKKKCFTLRRNTERPATIASGSNTLIDASKESDRTLVLDYAKNPVPPTVTIPPLWDGRTGERVVELLRTRIGNSSVLLGARDFLMGHCTGCGDVPVRRVLRAGTASLPHSYRITEESHVTCWDIVRCEKCGLLFSQWKLTTQDLHGLYQSMEDELYDEEDAWRRSTYQKNLALIEKYTSPGRLLDIGCATGGLLLEAQKRGWAVEGVDLSHWAMQKCHERGIALAHEGTVDAMSDASARFNAITMLDYIEHDTDPRHLLARARDLLLPGGYVYISTPDSGSLLARLLGASWWGMNPLHLTYFSRRTLSHLLQQEGFDVQVVRSYARRFSLEYWASRLAHFHPLLARGAVRLLRLLHLSHLPLSLTLGDAMEVLARKRG